MTLEPVVTSEPVVNSEDVVTSKPVVTLEGVNKTYHAGIIDTHAAFDVNLTINKGEFTSIVGPSGSGKTTLINLIGGLDTADNGTIFVEDREITAVSERELSEIRLWKIGFIFQAYNLIPVLTALENVEYVMLLQGMDLKTRTEKALYALDQLDMADLAHKKPSEMSGGQQQRVSVARAIASEPSLILADEPTANLDSATSEKLIEYMKKLNREKGLTFVFASHDPIVVHMATRVVTIKDGVIVSDENT